MLTKLGFKSISFLVRTITDAMLPVYKIITNNKKDNVFTDERDLKGLRAKVQDSRFRFVT